MKKLIDEWSGLDGGRMVAQRRDGVSGGEELGNFTKEHV